jgi:hypothetical protein
MFQPDAGIAPNCFGLCPCPARKWATNPCAAAGFRPGPRQRQRRSFGPLQARKALLYAPAREHLFRLFLGSSAVEHSTVNRMVAGSNPARGAKSTQMIADCFDKAPKGAFLVGATCRWNRPCRANGNQRTRQRERSDFPGFCNRPETNTRSNHRHRVMERDMNTAIARYLARSSEKTTSSFENLVSVAIFSGVGLLISLSVLLLDRYIPGDWF